ncbi:MAG: hypothetical protein ABIF18_03630 [archaeon]
MEIEEIVKILIFVLVLVIMVGAVIFLFKGKGFEVLNSIKDVLRFGR